MIFAIVMMVNHSLLAAGQGQPSHGSLPTAAGDPVASEVSVPVPLGSAFARGPVSTTRPADTKDNEQPQAKAAPSVIVLNDKKETIERTLHGSSSFDSGKITVNAERNTLKATLCGTTNAYAYILCHSSGRGSVHLEQEFEIKPGDPGVKAGTATEAGSATVSLSLKLDGYFRTDRRGGARLEAARAEIHPIGGEPAVGLELSPRSAGPSIAARVMDDASSAPKVLPLGRYVLIADLVMAASADHFSSGHGEADFSPKRNEGIWSEPNPFEDVEPKDFGLVVSVKTEVP
jgi:hypothetical protein